MPKILTFRVYTILIFTPVWYHMQTTVNEHIHVRVQSNIRVHVITVRLQYKIITNSFVSYSRL